jgi:hypothetical protein
MSDYHWGLTQWFCGIKEYVIDRCLCCAGNDFNPRDPDRMFAENNIKMSTNCCCVFMCATVCLGNTCLFDNPIGSLLCLPFALPTHLFFLPCACYSISKETGYKVHILTKEEEEEEKRKKYEERIEEIKKLMSTSSYTPSYSMSSYISPYSPLYKITPTSNGCDDFTYRKIQNDQYQANMFKDAMNANTWYNSPLNQFGYYKH